MSMYSTLAKKKKREGIISHEKRVGPADGNFQSLVASKGCVSLAKMPFSD